MTEVQVYGYSECGHVMGDFLEEVTFAVKPEGLGGRRCKR